MAKVTKALLVGQVSIRAGINRQDAERAISAVFSTIVDSCRNNDEVSIREFGTFRPHVRPARAGRNPRTGETQHFPAKRVLQFRPSRAVRESISQ